MNSIFKENILPIFDIDGCNPLFWENFLLHASNNEELFFGCYPDADDFTTEELDFHLKPFKGVFGEIVGNQHFCWVEFETKEDLLLFRLKFSGEQNNEQV